MIDKQVETCREAVSEVFDGATIVVGGFGEPGTPARLLDALREQGTGDLTIIHNGAGSGEYALGGLMLDGRVRKLITSFPNYPGASSFRARYLKGEVELELVPQGTLVERLRAAGAGLGGFYTRTAAGTELGEGKETRIIDGKPYVLEKPLHADFAFIKAWRGDRWGNLTYRLAMRNFNPIMATAGRATIAEVEEVAPLGELAAEEIHTPGIFVDRFVRVDRHPLLFVPQTAGGGK